MQDPTRVSRGTLIIFSTAAALAICYTTYHHFWRNEIETSADTQLHRSNAVRRRRRAWRSSSRIEETGTDSNRISTALDHLREREALHMGYGYYNNQNYVNDEVVQSGGITFLLAPQKLVSIRNVLAREYSMSREVSEQLMVHLKAIFVQEFLREELEGDHLSDAETEQLCAGLEPEIEPELVRSIIQLRMEGRDVNEDMAFDETTERQENPRLPHAEHLASVLQQGGSSSRRTGDVNVDCWNETQDSSEGNNVLDLLYRIGEEKAKWSGYQHRGVECNACHMTPIRGIRYHCANCWDYDLCEACEHQQIHHKTHVFYKIRIPAPTKGQIKLVQPKWYPGDPNACPESIPQALKTKLLQVTNVDRQDLDALYDQFKCIAGRSWPDDTDAIGMAIDRNNFNKYFTSTTADRPPRPNLIYDRIFNFYDKDGNGVINFSEFAIGMSELANNTSREARIERLFEAFDLDGDGYVSRRDFLYMLQAYYALNKELVHEMVFAREDAFLTDEEMLEVIYGSNPISATFGGSNFAAHRSRHGQGKQLDVGGDLVLKNQLDPILKEDSTLLGDRAEAIARQASDARGLIQGRQALTNPQPQDDPIVYGYHLPPVPTLREEDSIMGSPRSANAGVEHLGHISDSWPLDHVVQEDVREALGANIPLDEVMDPLDRRRVLAARRDRLFAQLEENNQDVEQAALHDRWQRREFYTDADQGLSMPAGYAESDSSGPDSVLPWNSTSEPALKEDTTELPLRSRSSSKVRFDESTIENDNESKSDISSRYTPVNERWGGFEMGQPDRDIGVEIIYEAVQEAFNDMLDHFFKAKEDKAIEAKGTRLHRHAGTYAEQLQSHVDALVDPQDPYSPAKEPDYEKSIADKLLRVSRPTPGSQSHNPQHEQAESKVADPTLPQHRPNAEGFEKFISDSPGLEEPKLHPRLLQIWHEHELIEKEAEAAGGFGRLSKKEFRQKLRDEHSDIDIGSESTEENFWEAKADLGKFSFLSDWLEMASF